MSFEKEYLDATIKRFQMYKDLGDRSIAQLSDEELHYVPAPGSNSMAIIIQHMYGNMLSRWTNFLTEDGEKSFRDRDGEFEEKILDRSSLLKYWEEGWKCLFNALESLQPADLDRNITIRTESLRVIDAINRQLGHYPYHVGQMVFLAKMIRGNDWQNLSIPKAKSLQFNESMKK